MFRLALLALTTASCSIVPVVEPREVDVTVRLAPPSTRVEVTLIGDFGPADGQRVRMARGIVGHYTPLDFARFIRDLRVFDTDGVELEIQPPQENGGAAWRVRGVGDLGRISYSVDLADVATTLDDESAASKLSHEHAFLIGYNVFVLVDGVEDLPHVVTIERPQHWRVATPWTVLPDGRFRAANAFELLNEPFMAGAVFRSREVANTQPRRFVHVHTDGTVKAEVVLDKLAAAAKSSARALDALGAPGSLGDDYHIFFHVRQPREGERLGWALEHDKSFHCTAPADIVDWSHMRLTYHVAHHEIHAWLPRRLYTGRLHPRRQWNAEPTEFIWFAEGFAQYLTACALAKSGEFSRQSAIRYIARRFAPAYRLRGPETPVSMTALSDALARGDHTHWFHGFAAGGLLAIWIDQQMRARDPAYGLLDALLSLDDEWLDHATGIPEQSFEAVLSEHTRFDLAPLFRKHVRGTEPLPVEEILDGLGVFRAGRSYDAHADEDVSEAVRAFREAAF